MKYDYVLAYEVLRESGFGLFEYVHCESWVADAAFIFEKDLERYKDIVVLMENSPLTYRNVYLLKLP
jgi:hypothetical protein